MERNKIYKKNPLLDDPTLQNPNLQNYDKYLSNFSWTKAGKFLSGLPKNQGMNISYEAVDRHAQGALKDHTALRWLSKNDFKKDYTFEDLRKLSNRFANVLAKLLIPSGEPVVTLLGRIPELYVAALGTWKNKNIFCPLFSAFGPEPIQSRLSMAKAKVLITTQDTYRKKIELIRNTLPDLKYLILIPNSDSEHLPERTLNYSKLMAEASDQYTIPPTKPTDPAILHFTSGTTGKPKGAIHVHEAVIAHHFTGQIALDFHHSDVFWCTADPGWVTGTSYGIISPLSNGITSIIDESDFEVDRWYRILQNEKVSIWYTAPTAVRMMMKVGKEIAQNYDLSSLRFIASVGEPLNPEAVWWGEEAFGLPIHDNWWQTETGGIMIANYLSQDIKPGSMGRPLPGIEAAIVQRTSDGGLHVINEFNVQGELALKVGWPSMFRGYLGEAERYKKCFAGDFYPTGDLATKDADGYFWFVGRADDVIKSAGHLIGPFEVESTLMEHPAVAEAAVIGKPDPISMEIVKAFISLKRNYEDSEQLRSDILGFARKKLGAAIAPKELSVLPSIPKTRSGKLMRRLLKARELGLPEGDTSTLETNL